MEVGVELMTDMNQEELEDTNTMVEQMAAGARVEP